MGPTENYGFLSDASKLVLSFCMLLGRLEFFSLLSLFAPSLAAGALTQRVSPVV